MTLILRRLLVATLALLLLAAPAASARPTAKGKRAIPRRCVGRTATLVAFTPSVTRLSGVLSWRRPLLPRSGRLSYRVLRDGVTIGQTRHRRMKIRVRPGRRLRLTVRTMRADGRWMGCTTTLVYDLRRAPPSPPGDLAASDVTETAATLTWSAGRVRAGRLAGYRVFRDGEPLRQVPGRTVRVAVSSSRAATFTVATVDTTGYVSAPSNRVTIRSSHKAPTAPHDLSVSDVSESGATLGWQPGAVSAGRIAGYRVFRDGVLLRQVPDTTLRVALSSNRDATFTVATADTLGYVSAQSAPVTIVTGHGAPSAPGGLTVSGVSDSGFELHWQPSVPTGGRIVGYRVFRDGALLRQVTGTGLVVDGLAPAQSYELTVVAIDSLGYESPMSDPVTVGTERPEQTSGGIHAFLLASTGASFTDLRAHYRQVGTVYPTYFECDIAGAVAGRDDALVTRWSQLRGIRVMPRVDCQFPARLHAILTDPAVRAAALDRLGALVATHGYDGLNVDFEAGLATDRDALTRFVTDLAARLHGQGKRISVAVSATTKTPTSGRAAFYDYPGLGAVADTVFVMNWGKHWSTSVPGAIADLPWATQVADFIATMPDRGRYVLGSGLYGMDWAAGGGPSHPANPLEFADVQNLIAAVGATPVVDPVSGAPHFSYTDAAGVAHDVWYTDATSLAASVRLAADRGLGFGVWRLGLEDQQLWQDPLLAPGAPWPG